jgi:hypothetical protein
MISLSQHDVVAQNNLELIVLHMSSNVSALIAQKFFGLETLHITAVGWEHMKPRIGRNHPCYLK